MKDSNSGNINIDEKIYSTKFSCNLEKCKGGCCTVKGTLGAPVKKEEIEIIYSIIDIVKDTVNTSSKSIMDDEGFYVHQNNKYYLNTIDDADCVFTYYDGDIAKCVFQKLFYDGKINFKKPVSCELFPIRVMESYSGRTLRYEEAEGCKDALLKGEIENVTVYEFAENALKREFGENFYERNNKR